MSWVAISLIAASVTAMISIFDKTIIGYARSQLTLPLLIGFSQTTIGIVVVSFVIASNSAKWDGVIWSLISGALFGLGGQLHIRILFSREVSRTIPITETSPIFASLIAVTFLGEFLTVIQWTAIVTTVIGAALLSLRTDSEYSKIFLDSSFYLLMLGAFIMAISNVTSKIALDDLPILFTHGLRMLALGIVFLAFNLRTAPWEDVRSLLTKRSPALLIVSLNEIVIANVGLVLTLWALSLGSVSLVTALLGTRAFFVVAYSTLVAVVWRGALGENITPSTIAVKIVSTVLIVSGVAVIVI